MAGIGTVLKVMFGGLLLLATGCAQMLRPAAVPSPQPRRASPAIPVVLRPPVISLPAGAHVGGFAVNPNEPYTRTHTWSETFAVNPAELSFSLRDELSSHGYQSVVRASGAWTISADVIGLIYNVFGTNPSSGWNEAEVTVRWVLRGPREIVVVSRGVATARQHNLTSVFRAFRGAVKSLLSDEQVVAALNVRPTVAIDQKPLTAPATALPAMKRVAQAPPADQQAPVARTSSGGTGLTSLTRPAASPEVLSGEALGAFAGRGVVTVLVGDGWASGVVLSADGFIATQASAVRGGAAISVVTKTGAERPARVVRSDQSRDLALLQADGGGFEPLPLFLGGVTPAASVVAVGTPFHSALSFSVSPGRVLTIDAEHIRTSARVSAGNGGGPLVDSRGRVVGLVIWPFDGDAPAGDAVGVSAAALMRALGLSYVGATH